MVEIKEKLKDFIRETLNSFLSKNFLAEIVGKTILENDKFGANNSLSGKKIIIEYTDPNPFKEFHIGHLMSNTIGEAISRLVGSGGAVVRPAGSQGDAG